MTVLNDLQVRKQIVTVLEPLRCEPNDGVSRAAARAAVEKLPSMSRVVCDETNNSPRVLEANALVVSYVWNKVHCWNVIMSSNGFAFEQTRG